jgi:hypothetical protein
LAVAETMSFGDAVAMLAKGCGTEITSYCRGVNLDSTRLKECLSRNQDVTSPTCKSTYLQAVDAINKRIAARVTVANACTRGSSRSATARPGNQQVGALPGDGKRRQRNYPAMVTRGTCGPRPKSACSRAFCCWQPPRPPPLRTRPPATTW